MGSLPGSEVNDEGVWATSAALGVGHMRAVGKVMMTFPELGPTGAVLGTGAVGKVMMRFPCFCSDELVSVFAATRFLPALLADLFLHLTLCFFGTGLTFRVGSTFWLANLGRRGGRRLRAFSTSLGDGGGLAWAVRCEEGARDALFLEVAAPGGGRGLRAMARDSGRLRG